MNSSASFQSSQEFSPRVSRLRRKSKFTFKQLASLASSATSCPLRVVAHIDLDAFYAQCETVRLGISEDTPLAVQQWQGLIAINYPARAFGLSRHVTTVEAQKACPDIILQHVATWKEGDEKWAYHEDAWKHIATHKVSLDPYRLQSRRILATIKEALPASLQKVEKASIDEVFLDLSAQIHSVLLERYPELRGPAPYDDPTEKLPAPPTTALDWQADGLVDLDSDETEDDDPDWDDVAMLIASEIVRDVRATIREKLKYTCSAGLARNKMLAKLGSSYKKPNQQSIIRNRAIQQFLGDMKFTKIRNLGGKLGEDVSGQFGTEMVKDLLEVPLDQFKKKIGDDTGTWLYQTIRGEDYSEVNSRTQIKSMLSAKSFRPTINSFEQGVRWLRIFAADIFSRLVEEGVLENKRRPKSINLHHRQSGVMRSKQAPVPTGKTIDEMMLFELAKSLLAQVIVDGRAWPCANLSLSVGGFEDGPTGNRGIGGFLVRGEEAKAMQTFARPPDDCTNPESGRPEKRRRTEGPTINNFFHKQEHSWPEANDEPSDFEDVPSAQVESTVVLSPEDEEDIGALTDKLASTPPLRDKDGRKDGNSTSSPKSPNTDNNNSSSSRPSSPALLKHRCSRCGRHVLADEQAEHDDWHFAKDMQAEEEQRMAAAASAAASAAAPVTPAPQRGGRGGRGRGRGGGAAGGGTASAAAAGVGQRTRPEKGQSRLAFGR